jgi:hypothetical protein
VPLKAACQTPNLEENQGFRALKLSPQEVPASEATLANPAAEGGTMGEIILSKVATSTSLLGSFTCRKARHGTQIPLRRKACWGLFRPKKPTASAGFEPANLGTKGQHATSRPPKPLQIIYYKY